MRSCSGTYARAVHTWQLRVAVVAISLLERAPARVVRRLHRLQSVLCRARCTAGSTGIRRARAKSKNSPHLDTGTGDVAVDKMVLATKGLPDHSPIAIHAAVTLAVEVMSRPQGWAITTLKVHRTRASHANEVHGETRHPVSHRT